MADELKACPFCGGKGELTEYAPFTDINPRAFTIWVIGCISCAAEAGWQKTPKGAARSWNMRTDEEKAAEQ